MHLLTRTPFAVLCTLGSVWLCMAPMDAARAQADALLDFSTFQVPLPERRAVQNPLRVRWLIRADAQTHCDQATPQDGHARRPEGCVYWHLAQGSCTVVTTASTTHSQLGHLYLHCLNGY